MAGNTAWISQNSLEGSAHAYQENACDVCVKPLDWCIWNHVELSISCRIAAMSWVAGTLSTTLLHTAIPLLCREVIELSFTLSGLCCWTTMPHGENCSEGRCKRVLGLFFLIHQPKICNRCMLDLFGYWPYLESDGPVAQSKNMQKHVPS